MLLSFLSIILSIEEVNSGGKTTVKLNTAAGLETSPRKNDTTAMLPFTNLETELMDTIIPIEMYYQGDSQWSHHLYGNVDPMASHGCGPTALAIAVSSLSDTSCTPIDAAIWADDNGYHASGQGSYHEIIPEGAKAYNLTVERINTLTFEFAESILSRGKLIVLLVGPGDFTDGGHFIIIHGYTPDGLLYVADPASEENSNTLWDAEVLNNQLSKTASASGPIWILSN